MPPSHLLLCHLHPNQTKIWHLWTRILSCNKSTGELETVLDLDQNPLHYQDRPQKPHVLKVPKETEQEDSTLAWMSTRLQLQNCPHCRKNKHTSWCAVLTSRRRCIRRLTRNSTITLQTVHQCVWSRLWWIPQTPNSPNTMSNKQDDEWVG